MSTIVEQQQPELLHYGVKGMKWGVRNRTEIKGARRRNEMKRREIERTMDSAEKRGLTDQERITVRSKAQTMKRELKNNPDRVSSSQITAGEAIASVLVLGPAGLVVIGGMTARSAGIAANQANRRNKAAKSDN